MGEEGESSLQQSLKSKESTPTSLSGGFSESCNMMRLSAFPMRVLQRYDSLLTSHRLKTTTATGALLGLAGDAATQLASNPIAYDSKRGTSFALFGGAVTGPVNYLWLQRLDSLVNKLAPMGGWRAVSCKLGVQTFFFQPFVYVPLFFTFSSCTRGWTTDHALQRIREDYKTTLLSLWTFWTPICVLAFSALPMRQQAPFFSAVSLIWNGVLSFLSNKQACSSNIQRSSSSVINTATESIPSVPQLSQVRLLQMRNTS